MFCRQMLIWVSPNTKYRWNTNLVAFKSLECPGKFGIQAVHQNRTLFDLKWVLIIRLWDQHVNKADKSEIFIEKPACFLVEGKLEPFL